MTERVQINQNSLRANFDLSFPFNLPLPETSLGSDNLECVKLVRALPGKRLVCAGKWQGEDVFVKIFIASKKSLRHCRREEAGIRALISSRILTPPLLYSGYVQQVNGHVLIFKAINDGESVFEIWKQLDTEETRFELLSKIVRTVAEHHEAGLLQKDLHLGNFLKQGEHIYTLDGSSIIVHNKPLGRKKSLNNLGLLLAQLYPQFDGIARQIYHEYVQVRKWSTRDSDAAVLQTYIEKNRERRKNKYLKYIYRETSNFVCQKSFRRVLVLDRRYASKEMMVLAENPDGYLANERCLLKKGNTSTLGIVEIYGKRYVIKRYNIKSLWHGMNRAFRRTRASTAWRNLHLLEFLGIKTATPILFMEKRIGWIRRTSYLVTEFIEGPNAEEFFLSDAIGMETQAETAAKIKQLMNRLGQLKIRHGDMKATNFIIRDGRPYLLDVDALRQYKTNPFFRKSHRQDIFRFLRNWEGNSSVRRLFDTLTEKT